jgi:hypothetical protein
VALYWHLVEVELRRRGHETVAVDLPADDEKAGLPEYADTVMRAAGERGELRLVAQSLGGFTAPLVAERMPVEEIIFVNAMIPQVGETAGQWWDNTGQPQARRANDARDGRDPEAEFDMDTYFLHDLPAEEREAVLATGRNQTDTLFGQPYPLKEFPRAPLRVITANGDRFFPADFQARVARERLRIEPVRIPGGHLAALSQPAALTDAILGRS